VFAILAMVWLLRQPKAEGVRRWQSIETPDGAWMFSAMVHVLLFVAVFSLSAGKRADYLAPCYPQAALLAAFWLVGRHDIWRPGWPATACIMAAVTLAAMSWDENAQNDSPSPTVSRDLDAFVQAAAAAMDKEPLPATVMWVEDPHLQAMLGMSEPTNPRRVRELLAGGKPFWLLAGDRKTAEISFESWLAEESAAARAVEVVRDK
jgi:4-amino-4-deoxy-L-arabinose transferase-like glycosyltransferase